MPVSNPTIGGLGHRDVLGLSTAYPCPRPRISIHTMPRDAEPQRGAGPVGSWAVSGASGWQALLSTVAVVLDREISADVSLSLSKGRLKA